MGLFLADTSDSEQMLSGGRLTALSSRRAPRGYTIHCGFGKPAHRRSAQGLQAGEARQAADANVPGRRAALWEGGLPAAVRHLGPGLRLCPSPRGGGKCDEGKEKQCITTL